MCGVLGIKFFDGTDAREYAASMLFRLQHRGQDGAGLTILSKNNKFETTKGLGLIQAAIQDWQSLSCGSSAVAHTRYTTTGTGGVGEVQPFVDGLPKLALAFNGNIINCDDIVKNNNLTVKSNSDLEVIQQLYIKLKSNSSFPDTINKISQQLEGAYAVIGLNDNGSLFGFRDKFGIRPLFMAKNKKFVALASETTAFEMFNDLNESIEISEVKPGNWIRIKSDSDIEQGCVHSSESEKFCMFEMVYFSSPQSKFKNVNVFNYRYNLGKQLALEISKIKKDIDYDCVIPVPESSRPAALAVSELFNIPYREYFVKNAYVPRTFIMNTQLNRKKAINNKLNLISSEVKGKKVLLVDDSIVRGNTSRSMMVQLNNAGAKEVAIATTCPPIKHGCYYGIDFPDQQELVAYNRSGLQIKDYIGVDELFYISLEGLKKAFDSSLLCTACLDGEYPIGSNSFEKFLVKRKGQRS